jgi:hypothetical protein
MPVPLKLGNRSDLKPRVVAAEVRGMGGCLPPANRMHIGRCAAFALVSLVGEAGI